ncbi:MAG: acetyl-CoA carboxylase biotin carboxyl carrier protein [Myxococcales bacterium]|nr:acetyl-CoA carboxylase biotin carboxyl carrier protein [Myxococcales bacterium]
MAGKSEGKKPGAEGSSLDVEALRQIVELLEASEVTRLVWTNGKERLSIRRGPPATHVVHQVSAGLPLGPPAVAVAPVLPAVTPTETRPRPSTPTRAPVAEAGGDKKGHLITSPFVGTFYRSPSPESPAFVEVGSPVRKGQVLCIVEAMKLMNEIESEVAGKVAECLVQNAQPVEFGQPLFRIEPA